eukprot:Selendium_serpulae@DN6457_c0_g1_i10.p1
MVDKATGRNRGFGFVTLEDEREKDKVFDKDHFIRDKRCSVRQMQPEGVSNLKRKVFIGGINPALTENDLEPYFKTWGPLEKVTIMRDLESNSRGFGFVIFMDEETCKRVVDHRVHTVDKNNNKVECRQAEARGRVPSRPGAMPGGPGAMMPPSAAMFGRPAIGVMGTRPGYYPDAYAAAAAAGYDPAQMG